MATELPEDDKGAKLERFLKKVADDLAAKGMPLADDAWLAAMGFTRADSDSD